MKYTAEIDVMPLEELLDPQGKALMVGFKNLGMDSIASARVGKHIRLELDAKDEEAAKALAEDACKKLLANTVVEGYQIVLKPMETV